MASNRASAAQVGHTLILWGDYFDELATTLLASSLRQAGLSVKLVGIGNRYATGRCGITIRADLSGSDTVAIADHIACVVLPCQNSEYKQIANDPRMQDLLQQLFVAGKLFVVHQELYARCLAWSPSSSPERPSTLLVYPEDNVLPHFASSLTNRLAGELKASQQPSALLQYQLFPSHLPQFAAP